MQGTRAHAHTCMHARTHACTHARTQLSLHSTTSSVSRVSLLEQLTACVAERRRRCAAPAVAFSRGGTTLLPDAVAFPVSWDGVPHLARLSQAADGRAVIDAQAVGTTEANAEASAWLADLFSELILDLDGCALSFRQLKLVPAGGTQRASSGPGRLLLELELGVNVRSFPSLDVNF